MKHIKIFIAAMAIFGGIAVSSCSDPDDIQDLVLDRVLSPTGISARVSQNLNIVVSWDEMTGATGYIVEGYMDAPDYDRTPDFTVTSTETTVTVTNLIGETTYYIRVRAIDGQNPNRASKWVEVKCTTLSEQNMNKIKQGDITHNSVTITWTPGIAVDQIVITPTTAGSAAETVTKTLEPAEIENGSATVSGLQAETNYRATLKYGDKTRGFATFKTGIDFTTGVTVNTIEDLVSTLESATPGTKIALAPGRYELTGSKLKINNSVLIGAQDPANMPVLNTCIQVYGSASLHLYQLVLDGTNTDGSQAIDYKEAGSYSDLNIDGCEIKNYTKGFYYVSVAAAIENLTINNCIIHDIECSGGDMFDCRAGYIGTFTLSNSTIYESAKTRDVFRMDDASASLGGAPTYIVTNNTFYNVGHGDVNYRIFYIRYANNKITFTNNVVANFNNKRGFANTSTTDNYPTLSNNLYYNTVNLMKKADGNSEAIIWFDEQGTDIAEDPFTDAASYNFYLKDEELRSKNAGDPRWY